MEAKDLSRTRNITLGATLSATCLSALILYLKLRASVGSCLRLAKGASMTIKFSTTSRVATFSARMVLTNSMRAAMEVL